MDNHIIDKGWTAMQKLLDREMPQDRRPKFAWWWIGLLLLPIVGYGSWLWLGSENGSNQKTNKESGPASTYPTPIAQNNALPAASQQSLLIPAEENSQVSSKSQKISSQKATGSVLENSPSNEPKNSSFHPTLSDIQTDKESAGLSAPPIRTQIALDWLTINAQSIEESVNAKAVSIPTIDLAGTLKPVPVSSKKSWAFGATTNLSSEQLNSINGFSTGLTIDWKFAKKWGLRTGVLYNIHTPQDKYRPIAAVHAGDYESNVNGEVIILNALTGQELYNSPGNNFYGDSLGSSVFIPVNRLHRLEIPVTAFWQVARPLKIIGGMTLTRTLTTKADQQNYSGDYILKLANRTAEDGASKLSSNELDNWSVDATLGVGVKLSKAFELGFSAKMPLSQFPGLIKSSHPVLNSGFIDQSIGATRKQIGQIFSLHGTLFF
ncbi:MAG: hypothetical protein ACKVT2_23040 [Saprospiraceae bacterium]